MGIEVIDIRDIQNPVALKQLITYGGEGIFISEIYRDVLYLADGYNGLTIINASNPLEPYIISQTPYEGWGMKLTFSKDEKYIFLA